MKIKNKNKNERLVLMGKEPQISKNTHYRNGLVVPTRFFARKHGDRTTVWNRNQTRFGTLCANEPSH